MTDPRLAIVHDYLNQYGGGERFIAILHEIFPSAPVFTSVYDQRKLPDEFGDMDVRTSFLQNLPFALRAPKLLLPLYPIAFESLDVRSYDVVLSSTSAFAKGVITDPETLHVCYCHTPMRFAWRYHDYMEREGYSAPVRYMLAFIINRLRSWDVSTSSRVDYFIANSTAVAQRIQRAYRRHAEVIHAPVECDRFHLSNHIDDYFLLVSRLRPYKRSDIAIAAFNELGLPLKVIGDGDDRARLQRMAAPNIEFLGYRSDAEVAEMLARCQALVFPGEEDFGRTPVEAQASGRPVIAYAKGGALDTVVEGETGAFFQEPHPQSLVDAVRSFDAGEYDPVRIQEHARQFDVSVFARRIKEFLTAKAQEHRERMNLNHRPKRGANSE
jgi:glycosyltransferase involved in cell wall biosynthesis